MAGPDALERFTRYADLVGRHLGDLIDHTCTINEPQIVALFGHLQGHHPPGRRDPTAWRRVTERFKQAHAAVADLVPSPGLCLQMPDLQPARPGDPAAEALTRELDETMIETYLDGLPGSFVGVQYYTRMRVDPGSTSLFGPAPPGAPLTQMGWELHPEGLHRATCAPRQPPPGHRHRERHRHRRRRRARRLPGHPPGPGQAGPRRRRRRARLHPLVVVRQLRVVGGACPEVRAGGHRPRRRPAPDPATERQGLVPLGLLIAAAIFIGWSMLRPLIPDDDRGDRGSGRLSRAHS
ncbi:MAG TPA: family 1 glycosylhydrolase [Solirubrobacteraceae bacterium]|nr:family 1 glycosylhydrolase [Solirubrobacteraceae bacterium]